MNKPYTYTRDEWNSLGPERFHGTTPALGSCPYHSNYHLCSVYQAIQEGKDVPIRVIESYEGTARNTIEMLLNRQRNKQ